MHNFEKAFKLSKLLLLYQWNIEFCLFVMDWNLLWVYIWYNSF